MTEKFERLPTDGPSLFEEALQLARGVGSVHYVDDDGNEVQPLAQAEFSTCSQATEAAKVESLFGKRILVRVDDPDNEVNGFKKSDAHLTRKNTGIVLAVSKEVAADGVAPGHKVFWAGSRASDFPASIPGADKLLVLRYPEEVMGTIRETVRVRRTTGALEQARAELVEGLDAE